MKLSEATSSGDQLTCLKALADRLAAEIDACEEQRDLSALSRQYRETVSAISQLEAGDDGDDAVAKIVRKHAG